MNLLIIGTSNCIGKKTFVDWLENNSTMSITNISIGASSSNCGLYSLHALGEHHFDFAIIDLQINDREFWRFGKKDFEDMKRNLRSIIYECRRRDCVPIVAILPQCAKSALDEPSAVADLYAQIAREERVTFVDIARMFRKAVEAGAAAESLMRDPYHMSTDVVPVVGEVFRTIIEMLNSSKRESFVYSGLLQKPRAIEATAVYSEKEIVERSSAHRTARYVILRCNESVTIPLDAKEELIGVFINTGASGCKVGFTTASGLVVKSLVIYFDKNNPGSYKSIMVDFKPHLISGTDGIIMKLMDQDVKITDTTLYEQSPLPDRYGSIEVEGFLAISNETHAISGQAWHWPGVDLDILKSADEASLTRNLMAAVR